MKVSKNVVSVVLGMTLSFSAFATSIGSGVRGGGHVIDVDSTPYLMDLATKSVCEWRKGSEVMSDLPSVNETLKKLERLDWYFSKDLKDEISQLNFCMTGALHKVSPYDWGSVVKPVSAERPRQAAYRLYGSVYVDSDIFGAMNEVNRSMLVIHEAMHSYLNMATYERGLKLKSMIKALDQVRSGNIVTREKLYYNMAMNEIVFPFSADKLQKNKAAVLFHKSLMAERIQAILKTKNLDSLITLTESEVYYLASWDQAGFGREFQRVATLKEAIIATMQTLSPEELRMFLSEKTLKTMNIAKIALNDFYVFSEEQKTAILMDENFTKMMDSGFDELLNEKFEQKDFLILTSVEFQNLTVGGKCIEVMPLVRLTRGSQLPNSMKWLVETVIQLQENNGLSVITMNPKFYTALGLKNQKAQVNGMTLKIERERKVALEVLDNLSKGLVENLLGTLKARVSPEVYTEIVKQIDLNNF